jgi:hypothetical protein
LQKELKKYHIETETQYYAYVSWLAKHIQAYILDKGYEEHNFASSDDFLYSIEIDPAKISAITNSSKSMQEIESKLALMRKKTLFGIGKKYFPDLYEAYQRRILSKKDLPKKDVVVMTAVKQAIEKIMTQEPVAPSIDRFDAGIEDGVFFGKVLDLAAQHLGRS